MKAFTCLPISILSYPILSILSAPAQTDALQLPEGIFLPSLPIPSHPILSHPVSLSHIYPIPSLLHIVIQRYIQYSSNLNK